MVKTAVVHSLANPEQFLKWTESTDKTKECTATTKAKKVWKAISWEEDPKVEIPDTAAKTEEVVEDAASKMEWDTANKAEKEN